MAGALASVLLGFAALLAVPQTAHAQAPPEVSSVAITSDPSADETYARYFSTLNTPDVVEVTVTFDGAVDVTGTPRLELDFDGTPKAAACAAHGTDTTKLVCSYTVAVNDSAPNGIAIAANKLTLNSGTIKQSGSTTIDAVLTHGAVAIDSGHKVDGIRPTLVTTGDDAPKTSEDGTQIIFTVSEDIGATSIGSILVSVDSIGANVGATAAISGSTVTITLLPIFTIQHGQTVVLNLRTGGVRDTAGNRSAEALDQTVTNNVPEPAAAITRVAITSDPGTDGNYAPDDDIEVTATFDHAVTVTGKPRILLKLEIAISFNRWAEYVSGSGTTEIVFAYEVLATDESDTNGITVGQSGQTNTVDLNGGTVTEVVTGEGSFPELRPVNQRQRASGQLGAAGAVERRDVDGRDQGAADVQRRSRRKSVVIGCQLVHRQGGRYGRDAERIGPRLRQRRHAYAGHCAHLVDAGGDGELYRSHHRRRRQRHRGPREKRCGLIHRPGGDQQARRREADAVERQSLERLDQDRPHLQRGAHRNPSPGYGRLHAQR